MPPKRAPLPRTHGLMLCELVDEPAESGEWIFEPKLDGIRLLCRFDGKRVSLESRNGISQELQFPEIVRELERALDRRVMLDAEIVCLDDDGRSSFKRLQQR